MRFLLFLAALPIIGLLGIVLVTNVFRPPPAADRLAGLQVAVTGYTIDDLGADRHRLNLWVRMTSPAAIDECVAFTLDEPFASRRLVPIDGVCRRPQAGSVTVQVRLDQLTKDDLAFPSHTLVWGVPGGRCGPVLEAFGVCVVEQAGTADVRLPPAPGTPSFGPVGSFPPFGSFVPLFSFSP
jgi:hypothetical protein